MAADSTKATTGSRKRFSLRLANELRKAMLELNADVEGSGGRGISGRSEALKESIKAHYEQVSDVAVHQFWNWGMHDGTLKQEIIEILGNFDQILSDGYSEQLYYYTLKAVPRVHSAPRRILEVGCGSGAGLNFLSRIEPQSTFTGLELAPVLVARANEQYSRPASLTYVQGDAEHLPFANEEFDVVINVESSHNYPNLRRFFSEVARVLRPGGYFSYVDVFSSSRYAQTQRCKSELGAELAWLEEQDITERVREAIQRRMAPGSHFRRQLAQKARLQPWPLSLALSMLSKAGYGRGFADPQNHWSAALPWKSNPRLSVIRHLTSYRHALAYSCK